MLVKTEAVVLHSFKLGENKLIVDLFTYANGRMSVVVPLSKSPKSKIKKQIFQPLSIIEVIVDVRTNASLHKLKEAHVVYPYISIPFEPFKISISLFISEFLSKALRGEQGDEILYSYITTSLQWFDGRTEHFANFHIVFIMRLTRFLGFYPNLDGYFRGCCFDLRSGCFTGVVPMHRDFLPPNEASMMGLMMRMDYHNMHLFRMSHVDRNRLLDVVLHYYRLHLPDFPLLKSLDVLRGLYS